MIAVWMLLGAFIAAPIAALATALCGGAGRQDDAAGRGDQWPA